MNRIDLSIKLREVIAIAQYDTREAIKVLVDVIKELNDELEEVKRK